MLDIVVSFDTTGSMGPAIAEVRRKVEQFVDQLYREVSDLRIGIIAHGDYIDATDKYLLKKTNLVDSNGRGEIIDFIRYTPNTYGGDSDEAYEYVLKIVDGLDWREDADKVFIMIADADPHPVGYRYGNYTVTEDYATIAQRLLSRGIKVYPVQALARMPKTMYLRLARMFDTPRLELSQFSNITQLLTAITYKQQSNEKLEEYGQQLQNEGLLDRGLASAFNLLLHGLVGDITFKMDSPVDLEAVDPSRFQMLHVDKDTPIKEFVQSTGATFRIGRGFYELTKTEKVQEHKEVVLRNSAGDMFSGAKAREMIGLPYGQRGTVRPMRDLGYTVFIQSTSPNRKLMGNTRFLYEAH